MLSPEFSGCLGTAGTLWPHLSWQMISHWLDSQGLSQKEYSVNGEVLNFQSKYCVKSAVSMLSFIILYNVM